MEEYFLNFKRHAERIKSVLKEYLSDFEVYVFGSVVRGDYSPGLSDIDLAVVSDDFKVGRRGWKSMTCCSKSFDTPFEFHLLTRDGWDFYF